MHLRINDVTVSPSRVDELARYSPTRRCLSSSPRRAPRACSCAADRATGSCAIVSMWDSRESLDSSENAIASIRSATVDAVDAELNGITVGEVLSEVTAQPSKVGSCDPVVRISASALNTDQMVEFYNSVACRASRRKLASSTRAFSARLYKTAASRPSATGRTRVRSSPAKRALPRCAMKSQPRSGEAPSASLHVRDHPHRAHPLEAQPAALSRGCTSSNHHAPFAVRQRPRATMAR